MFPGFAFFTFPVVGNLVTLLLLARAAAGQEPVGGFTSIPGLAEATPLERAPRLSHLSLRCGRLPITLEPQFSSEWFNYRATLGFALGELAVDAIAEADTAISNLQEIESSILISPGGQRTVRVKVRSASSDNRRTVLSYTISMERLDGTDARLRSLSFTGISDPLMYDPGILDYMVTVPAEQNMFGLFFVPWDRDQSFLVLAAKMPDNLDQQEKDGFLGLPTSTMTTTTVTTTITSVGADPQTPMHAPDNNPFLDPRTNIIAGAAPAEALQAPSPFAGQMQQTIPAQATVPATVPTSPAIGNVASRRLGLLRVGRRHFGGVTGEPGHDSQSRWFLLSAANPRLVTISVCPANGDKALTATYRIHVMRKRCPPQRPYLSPNVGKCAPTCEDGSFPNASSGQCESCPALCVRCRGWSDCHVCEPTRWRSMHVVRLVEGRCTTARFPLMRTAISIAASAAILVFINFAYWYFRHVPPRRSGVAVASVWSRRHQTSDDSD